ncbi:MAG TPA: sugar phosphate isomerase/epimerase [Tepidisphaeraceae bacterium]|nr:sugar phosphate isomerase/epimerase [Tepidisphaeraceae bacterium]
MPNSQIAAQLYSLRDFLKTPEDIVKTLSRVKKMGYDAVQLSALGPIDSKELAKILKNEGLVCCATHVSVEEMRDNTQKVIDEHKLWDCKFTAIGGFFPKEPKTQDWVNFAEQFNAAVKKLDGSGITVGYHNHSHELAKYDGKTALQILLEKLSPKIWFEIDTYWIQHGGGDPIVWINKVKGRIPCVHFKDMTINNDRVQEMAEVGEGNLNWNGIIKACKEAGVQWYIVEQDHWYGRDGFAGMEKSLKNLKAMGIK